MRENKLKSIWARGEAVVNGWLSIPSAFSAEVMAHQGFDSLTVDMQHGVVDYQVAVTMLQAISTTGVDADGARAVERSRAADEDPRRRRVRGHLPDGQYARGGGGARARLQVSAARLSELGARARVHLCGRGLR